ncbi:hypothetical protein [Sorangium sp. So ce1389]|uniref:hypothetical protein n=1 Tax=Sorangium sp. So ce1389 TaxID=3133336 RepID=UPI003F5F22EC
MNSANATEFRRFLQSCFNEEPPNIPRLRPPVRSDAPSEQQAKWLRHKEWLEHHAREYIIDSILRGLNWQIGHTRDAMSFMRNIAPEVPLSNCDTTRFLDYLGFDHKTNRPLLIVEAKRPAAKLPVHARGEIDPNNHPAAVPFARYLKRDMVDASVPGGLTREWRIYLDQLKGYMEGFAPEHAPKRVVIMNGDWMVVFLDPADTFFRDVEVPNPDKIVIYPSKDSILKNAEQVFEFLAYEKISTQRDMVHVAEVAAIVDPSTIISCAFGLKVRHECHPPMSSSQYRLFPQLRVNPILIVMSNKGTFMWVESSDEEGVVVPREGSELEAHLSRVSQSAQRLKRDLETCLSINNLPLVAVEDHYSNLERFEACPGVVPFDPSGVMSGRPLEQDEPMQTYGRRGGTLYTEFILFTGRRTHFIVRDESFAGCPYHTYAAAEGDGAACAHGPIGRRSVDPRSYFVDGNASHCAHHYVFVKKRLQVLSENRSRCGPRSVKDCGAFCEIWGLEQHLCCRACVYQRVCTAAPVFAGLPCRTLT